MGCSFVCCHLKHVLVGRTAAVPDQHRWMPRWDAARSSRSDRIAPAPQNDERPRTRQAQAQGVRLAGAGGRPPSHAHSFSCGAVNLSAKAPQPSKLTHFVLSHQMRDLRVQKGCSSQTTSAHLPRTMHAACAMLPARRCTREDQQLRQ